MKANLLVLLEKSKLKQPWVRPDRLMICLCSWGLLGVYLKILT